MIRRLAPALVALALLRSGPALDAQKQSFSSTTLGVRVDVLVTDGRNPVGGLTAADFELRDNGILQTIDVVDSSDVPVNAVLALDTSMSTAGQRQRDLVAAAEARRRSPLKDLADATGGQLLEVTSSRHLRGAFQRILQDFRSRYILSYSPTGVPAEGFHRLEVRMKRRGLTAKARPGYIGIGSTRSK